MENEADDAETEDIIFIILATNFIYIFQHSDQKQIKVTTESEIFLKQRRIKCKKKRTPIIILMNKIGMTKNCFNFFQMKGF